MLEKKYERRAYHRHQSQKLNHAKIACLAVGALHGANVGWVEYQQAAWIVEVLRQECRIALVGNLQPVQIIVSLRVVIATQDVVEVSA